LYKLGNDTESIGVIEPSIVQAQRRQKLETAQVNAIWIRGTSPLFAYIGDPTHEPTPQMMEDGVDAITELRHSQAMAFPYYNKVDSINIQTDKTINDVMDNLMYGEAGAAGIPLPFVTGQGEATNRSTLATQKELFESNIQEKITNFDEDWNNQVMRKLVEINEFPEAELMSEELRLEEKDNTVSRLKAFFDMKALAPEEIRQFALKSETVVEDKEAYKTFLESADKMAEKIGIPIEEEKDSKKKEEEKNTKSPANDTNE